MTITEPRPEAKPSLTEESEAEKSASTEEDAKQPASANKMLWAAWRK